MYLLYQFLKFVLSISRPNDFRSTGTLSTDITTFEMCFAVRVCLTVFGVILIVLSLVLSLYVFPLVVKDRIEDTVKLTNGSDAYARWETLPIPVKYKIYFFNISNTEEVQHGSRPIVSEIGPYVYNQYRKKTNITEEDDTLSYFQDLLFEFDSEASYPLHDTDDITIANVPLMAVVTIAERVVNPLLSILDTTIDQIFGSPQDTFLRTTPRDFLFDGIFLGCDSNDTLIDVACRIIDKMAPPTLKRIPDGRFKFSLLSHKNNTDEGYFVVNSGKNNIDELGQISKWQGSSTLNTWLPRSTCDKVIGSDTTIYPPDVNPDSKINVFSVDICRSVALEYSSDTEYAGIFGHRFVAGRKMLQSPRSLASNKCYCLNMTKGIVGEDGCLLDGAMELWTCQEAPVVLSLPHFYLANTMYQNGVDGLKPDGDLHEMYVDLEPHTGTPLRGHKKAQFNIFYRSIENIGLTKNLATTLVPIVWLDEGVELPDEYVDELNRELFDILDALDIIYWSLLGVGIILVSVNLLWWLVIWCKKRNSS